MERHRALNRRRFLAAAPALLGLGPKTDRPITGTFVNDSFPAGHRLRDRATFRVPTQQVRVPIVIIGGGMAGLSAAWHLDKRGFHDFVLLEMESQPGGNSRWGQNEVSRFPWAAHYVPVPAKGESLARELFEEFGVLRDGKWDDRALCFDPQERLFIYGRWQEGIEPENATPQDTKQYRRFSEKISGFRATGQFTIPMEHGAKPSPLDRLSMADWLTHERFDSPTLRWYINYACRDDYGALAKDTSAWAGIHYFASREPEEKGPLTWPEGNGWIAQRLIKKLDRYIRANSVVYRVARDGNRLRVFTEQTEYVADAVIFAAPTFLAQYLIEGAPRADGFQYSQLLLAKDWNYWKEAILNDLARAHPDIRQCVTHIDIMRMGHAMIRPEPGFMFSADRQRWLKPLGKIFFANSDLSGFSIFEEAQYRGVEAARLALHRL